MARSESGPEPTEERSASAPVFDVDAEEPYPSPAYAWYVVGVLVVIYIFSFIDRQILSLLVTPIRRDLQINDTQMSLLMGFSFAVFYTFFGIPLGRLADTRSRRGIIAAGLVVWSTMTAACGLARMRSRSSSTGGSGTRAFRPCWQRSFSARGALSWSPGPTARRRRRAFWRSCWTRRGSSPPS